MIEIENIEAVNKGALLAKCDVHIVPWKMTLHDVKIFEKGASRFLGMPSQQFENREGEIKYKELVTFDNDSIKKRFQSQVMKAVDEYLAKNPSMEPEPVIKADDEAPF